MNSFPMQPPRGTALHLALIVFLGSMMIGRVISEEVQSMISEPYTLPDRRVLTIITTDEWDGKLSTAYAVFKLSKPGETTQQEIYRHILGQSSSDWRGLKDRDSPAVLSVVQDGLKMAVLFHGCTASFASDGYYVLLQEGSTGGFEKTTGLDILGFLPMINGFNQQFPKSMELLSRNTIQVVHGDGFVTKIIIADDNSATINGKPCAPDNMPVTWINYHRFLRALSPQTEAAYDSPMDDFKPIEWWEAPAIPTTEPTVSPANQPSEPNAVSIPPIAITSIGSFSSPITPTQYLLWTLAILAGLGAVAFVIKRKSA